MKIRWMSLLLVLCLCASFALTGCGNSSSGSSTPTPVTPTPVTPTISAIAPTTLPAGAAASTLTVTGTGFSSTTTIDVGSATEATTYISSTQVTAAVPAAQLAAGGLLPVKALNGSASSTAAINLEVDNPVPTVTQVAPSAVVTGAAAATITVTGTGFVTATAAYVNGSARTTTYGSATQITIALTASDVAAAGQLVIAAVNPSPGGGSSLQAYVTVAAPAPTPVIASVQPTQFVAGTADTSIAVYGSGLVLSSAVYWNSTALQTTLFSSSNQGNNLYAVVPAALVAAAGTANITVVNPTASPSTSNAVPVSIVNPPAPTLTSISPASGPIGVDTAITLNGTGFTSASTVAYNGVNLPATLTGNGLTLTLPAASILLPGNGSFTVTTPAPGGGTTAPLTFTAYVGIVNNNMVYDAANGLFYVSVPSLAGAPYGNSVVSVDPATGALGTPILVGSEPNELAITSDGHYLWVGLDGAGAVRQVDLQAGVAGLQFSLGGNGGVYDSPATAVALAALPGAPNSVIVATTGGELVPPVAIYDSGVVRGTPSTGYGSNAPTALAVDGTRSEVYAAGPSSYITYTYSSTGLTQLASNTSGNYAGNQNSEIQVTGGRLYTDFGTVDDAESGSLLGTLYSSGSIVANGPTFADTTLGLIFVLDSTTQYGGTDNQVQVFKSTDFTFESTSVIPVNLVGQSTSNTGPSRLTRWGTNGLAFRTNAGVYSVRSNLVQDLSSVQADLGVMLAATGSNATGSATTYTATLTNGGPSAATNVALTALLPSTGILASATSSTGTCTSGSYVSCSLGGLAANATATVTFIVQQLTPGSAPLSVQVSGSETDPDITNNTASSSPTITGAVYTAVPSLAAISPNSVLAGSVDTVVTVTGSGFASNSSILLDGAALATTFTSATQLSATVPAAKLASLGWSGIAVSNAAPGGGVSGVLPLTVYDVITLGVNHILYDPFSRNIMASVGSGSSVVTGNSIVAITPDTATVGSPVSIGSQPTWLALTSDGQILYTVLAGSESVARYKMLTGQADYTYAVPTNSSFDGGIALRGISTQPGTENTIALDLASFTGDAIYDFDPANQTAAIRGQASGPYSGSCIHFLDSGDLLAFDTDTSGATFDHYTVTSAGFTYYNYSQYSQSTLDNFSCFQLSGGLAFANRGGIANPATVPATQVGVFQPPTGAGFYGLQTVAPDTSLGLAFFTEPLSGNANIGAVIGFNLGNYLPALSVSLDLPTIEGNTNYNPVDLIRWGQDGLALLTDGGHIYLLRGGAVVPQLLQSNSAAVLTSSSATTLTHSTGNTLLTLTGSNFVPGVAVTWNGGYRTTTIVDATHVTVAIPAADLAAAATGTLVATNPGAAASGSLTVTVQ